MVPPDVYFVICLHPLQSASVFTSTMHTNPCQLHHQIRLGCVLKYLPTLFSLDIDREVGELISRLGSYTVHMMSGRNAAR